VLSMAGPKPQEKSSFKKSSFEASSKLQEAGSKLREKNSASPMP